jgi:hypothetical protein
MAALRRDPCLGARAWPAVHPDPCFSTTPWRRYAGCWAGFSLESTAGDSASHCYSYALRFPLLRPCIPGRSNPAKSRLPRAAQPLRSPSAPCGHPLCSDQGVCTRRHHHRQHGHRCHCYGRVPRGVLHCEDVVRRGARVYTGQHMCPVSSGRRMTNRVTCCALRCEGTDWGSERVLSVGPPWGAPRSR